MSTHWLRRFYFRVRYSILLWHRINLTDAPSWAIDFMKEVPTTWDEVRFIDGYPGKYVILARRHGDKWYIAGVNAQKETLKLKLICRCSPMEKGETI